MTIARAAAHLGLLAAPLFVAATPALALAEEPAEERTGSTGAAEGEKEEDLKPALLSARSSNSIGSISVGHPHEGFLFNAVRMPEGPLWALSDPKHAYGTEETIRSLIHCIRKVHEQFPGAAPVVLGSISAENGGPLPPHKSHRSGRDADVYFFRKGAGVQIFKAATADDLDREKTWALLKAFITESDVEYVLIDRKMQALLEGHALSIGEDPTWISELFHGRGKYEFPLIKHVPGHVAHMHVRFVNRGARERGRLAYDSLVEQGHIRLPHQAVRHRVVRGDTLIGIAKKHETTVSHIMEVNDLPSSLIKVDQVLDIEHAQDLRDARAPVLVPWRPLPPPSRTTESVHASRGR